MKDKREEYWKSRKDGENSPASYSRMSENQVRRSKDLVKFIAKRWGKDTEILELGCNSGRNLDFLQKAGFNNLSALEINQSAIDHLIETKDNLIGVPIECISLNDWENKQSYDLIFSMAVLEHTSNETGTVFKEIARNTEAILTIEDEFTVSPIHFPRNYKKIFTKLGFTQKKVRYFVPGLPRSFVLRYFERV